jgi:mannose-6-phosphate isomerase-like protein (cupin superfamily)
VPGYTIKNLKNVEDAAPKFGLSPDVEARFAREALEAESTGMSYQRLAPNVRQTFGHRHAEQEEVYVVLGGSGRIKLDDDVVDVGPLDAVRMAPETMRCLEAGPDGLEFLAFSPRRGENDAEMTPGWWSG